MKSTSIRISISRSFSLFAQLFAQLYLVLALLQCLQCLQCYRVPLRPQSGSNPTLRALASQSVDIDDCLEPRLEDRQALPAIEPVSVPAVSVCGEPTPTALTCLVILFKES